ncbi:MAG: NfeD family protein [Planctomycetota bacterium]
MTPRHRFLTIVRFAGRTAFAIALAALAIPGELARSSPSASDAAPQTPATKGAILTLHDEITDITTNSLRRRIEQARASGAGVIVLDMNTPGGLVTSSIDIADLLRNLTGIKTVAWVHNSAYSGGALVAVACDEIVMARSSRIGDSQVIMGGPTGVTAIPEDLQPKAYTPVIHDFRTSARRNGYSLVLSEAFVVPEREVWWLENTKTGEREFVFREEKMRRLDEQEEADDKNSETEKEAKKAPTAKDVDGGDTREADEHEADGRKSLEENQSPRSGDLGHPLKREWRLVKTYFDSLLGKEVDARQPVDADDELLQMSPSEAIAFGFCKAVVSDEHELRERYNLSEALRFDPLWSESLALWMTSMYVRGFLMVIILLGAYVEFHTPGVGVPGLVALIALAIFVVAPYLAGLANIWEIVAVFVGLVLIAVELFVIPGFGVMGICGALMVLVGLVATFVPDEPGRSFPLLFPSLPSTVEAMKVAIITVVASMTASLLGMVMLSRYLPIMPVFRRLVPANPTPSGVSIDDPYRGAARVGDLGTAEGPLRPAGKARFADMLVDVVTQGEFLESQSRIVVIERRGNRVVVRAANG